MGKMLVITPDDEFLIKEYDGYQSLRTEVMGYIETVAVHPNISNIFHYADNPDIRDVLCHYLCNEEGSYASTGYNEKVNAIVTMMYEAPIFGAVAVVKLEDVPVYEDGKYTYSEPDDVGFTDEEVNFLKSKLEEIFNEHKDTLKLIHDDLDDAKKELMEEKED